MELDAAYVTPNGNPDGTSAHDSPLDLATAFQSPDAISPGTIVWIAGGEYIVNALSCGPAGQPDLPIIFRALPGERVTIRGTLGISRNHVWLWGLEIIGVIDGVILGGGEGIKVINCVVHDCGADTRPPVSRDTLRAGLGLPDPQATGIKSLDRGADHEIYGNIVYDNGWSALDHGIGAVNLPGRALKVIADNILFHNAGANIHCWRDGQYGMGGLYIEGNISFAASLDAVAETPIPADVKACIIVGSRVEAPDAALPLDGVTIRDNCTYQPKGVARHTVSVGGGAGGPHKDIVIEGNYFMGGEKTLKAHQLEDIVLTANTFWSDGGDKTGATCGKIFIGAMSREQLGKAALVMLEGNVHIGAADVAELAAMTPSAATEIIEPAVGGKPSGLHVFTRLNQYDPTRLHLAVYNWGSQSEVEVDLAKFAAEGESIIVHNVLDLFGKPVYEGSLKEGRIMLPMAGHQYEPEFGAYLVTKGGKA